VCGSIARLMSKIVLLGTGNGKADPQRFSPASVVWLEDEPVLVDVGNGALLRLRAAGIAPGSIRTLFLTHLHFDHYSDYPYLVIEPLIGEAAFDRGNLTVYGPPGTERLVRNFEHTYDVELDGYAGLEGYERVRELSRANVIEISEGWSSEVGGWQVSARMVDHGVVRLPCFGYRFDSPEGTSVAFSGDTVPCDATAELARGVDLLVHECNFPDEEVETRKRLGFAWYIHSTPSGVGRVARAAEAKRLALNHFVGWNDFSAEHEPYEWDSIAPPIIAKDYDGDIVVGADLMELEF
jgi:ribonuclease Z